MKINIWSDIRCPFCYIGKRKFELALEQFQHKDQVEVIWRSFQLDPGLKTQPETNVLDYLAKIKGITREQAGQMHEHVKEVAQEVGLTFNFEKSVLANSLNGHRLIQLAKANGASVIVHSRRSAVLHFIPTGSGRQSKSRSSERTPYSASRFAPMK